MKRPFIAIVSVAVLFTGCASSTEDAVTAAPRLQDAPLDPAIINGQRTAAAYSEAVLVKVNNSYGDFCSGVLIAPKVVLTAAHCVVFNPSGTWTIKAPFAVGGAQTRTATTAEPLDPAFYSVNYWDYDTHSELHDLAFIYLPTAFTGVNYPNLSATRYPIGASTPQVSAVGRDSVSVNAGLALSLAVTLSKTTAQDGYPFDNKTPRVTDGGDSGGPLFLEGTHTLVGTETRFDPARNLDYWIRLDGTVYDAISAKVAAHGGFARPLDAFRDEVSTALCARVAACCTASTPAYAMSSAKCREAYDRSGFEATARGLRQANEANVAVSASLKAACIQKIGNTSDCSVSSAEIKAAIADCIAAVSGLVAVGGACSTSLECAGNAACEKNAAGAGTCTALHASGASCEVAQKTGTDVYERDNLGQELCSKRGGGQTALYCDAYDFAGHAYRTESTWTCKPALANGAGCATNSYCASTVCAPYGDPSPFTCAASMNFVTPAVCTAFAGP